MEQKEKQGNKPGKRTAYMVIIGVLVILIAVSLTIGIPEYQRKQERARQIELETEQKLAELAELELQYNTMSGKINYTASQEYLLRYAREYLGYLLPGDIRIDVDNPDAPVPTAQLPLVTARPTPSPEPTGTPEV
ncbi:MAG: septum formation initiator family protein [Christensenellales bacterium]|nr:hypothetical protein [Clostridium sp.]MDY5755862.1 hypothetical protein [Eubacteriales bacterium]MDY5798010.1 hypothetical protein [Eubacteriales bacterium]